MKFLFECAQEIAFVLTFRLVFFLGAIGLFSLSNWLNP